MGTDWVRHLAAVAALAGRGWPMGKGTGETHTAVLKVFSKC